MPDPLTIYEGVTTVIGILGELKKVYDKIKDIKNLPEIFKEIREDLELGKYCCASPRLSIRTRNS